MTMALSCCCLSGDGGSSGDLWLRLLRDGETKSSGGKFYTLMIYLDLERLGPRRSAGSGRFSGSTGEINGYWRRTGS